MERVVARETPADHRCPYCHDALASGADLPADDLVECDGCRTRHHRACIEELGRCTIRGCERSLRVAPATALDQPVPAAELRSAVRREVERRLRERARTFVQANARAVGADGGREALETALAEARRAEARGDLPGASEAWHEVARRLTLARPEELRGVEFLELWQAERSFRLTGHATAQDVALAAEWAIERATGFARREALVRVRRAILIGLAVLLVLAAVGGLFIAVSAAGTSTTWALGLVLVLDALLVVALVAVLRALR